MQKKSYKILKTDANGKHYYEEYGSLNEIRAAIVQQSKEGILDGGVIFKPKGIGNVIRNDSFDWLPKGCYLYSGMRADFRPILDDGSLMPKAECDRLYRQSRGY